MKIAIVKSTYNLKSVETYEGETIETKVARIVQEKAPITDGAPIIIHVFANTFLYIVC